MSAKKSQPDPNEIPLEQLSYEDAFSALEEIVTRLENEKFALDQSLALFERGQNLARHCASLLEQAELKVQQLTDEGLVPFDLKQ